MAETDKTAVSRFGGRIPLCLFGEGLGSQYRLYLENLDGLMEPVMGKQRHGVPRFGREIIRKFEQDEAGMAGVAVLAVVAVIA